MLLHEALVSLQVFDHRHADSLRELVCEVQKDSEQFGLSSVYRVFGNIRRPRHIHDLKRVLQYEGFAAVARVQVLGSSQVYLNQLMRIQAKWSECGKQGRASLNLLTFDDEAHLTPNLTLPHPELLFRPDFLIPSAELWPEYLHPVVEQTLFDLARNLKVNPWGEFHCSGKSLLDFSPSHE